MRGTLPSSGFVALVAALAMLTLQTRVPSAQGAGSIPCPASGAEWSNPPEIQSAAGILKGTIYLGVQQQRLPRAENGVATCSPQLIRNFRRDPPREPVDRNDVRDPMPGPTLRAGVGDLVQLTFVNQIDSSLFERGMDIDECTQASGNGGAYPRDFKDEHPNCLHASSTANIHFHGTHTNPDSTGDNVYLQIRPLPRNNQGKLTTTPTQAAAGFDKFFARCAQLLRPSPLKSWPVTWSDVPSEWTGPQTALLKAYQTKNPTQPLWNANAEVLKAGGWPLYYIGAFPYCFALPAAAEGGATAPVMGQLPGTHWYHAHKHGSTAINVMNGMTGAFVIEGKYDDDLNAAYSSYILAGGAWNTRAQKVMVLNQLATVPNALSAGSTPPGGGVDFTVNGRLAPTVMMQPGEIQLWRIVNTSSRTAAFFMPPAGLEWRQIAQDGVQYDAANYQASLNRPFYMAPANRVDLLVKAPANAPAAPIHVQIQNVMTRSAVDPADGGRRLLTVTVSGPPVLRNGQPVEMPLLDTPPAPPGFLKDITDEEFRQAGSITRTLVFNSKGPQEAHQHTINGLQFADKSGQANIAVTLGAVEEWKVVNTTTSGIDHPLHIHINPFQVIEMFDPNEKIIDWQNRTFVDKFVFDGSALGPGQCRVNPDDESTWKPCDATKQGHWWDVSRIPTARDVNGKPIPGYFKMRSRFVDYPGRYVMHCHILIHEDRGMMFSVEVLKPGPAPIHH